MRLAHHLLRHPTGMWHFRLTVPRDLWALVGVRILKRSLHTRDPVAARHWAYTLGAHYAQLFTTARQLGKGMSGKRWDDDAVAKVMGQLGGGFSGWEMETPEGFKLRTEDTESDHAAGLKALQTYLAARQVAPAPTVAVTPPVPQSIGPTLADAILAYNETEGPNLKPDTWEQRKRACVSFAKAIGGKVRVDEVTRPMASSWATDLQRSGLAKRYVANMVSHVAQIFEAQIRAGHIPGGINPVKGVVIIRKSEKKALRDSGHAWEPLPEEALKRIYNPENLKRTRGIHVRWGALIGLYTGARVPHGWWLRRYFSLGQSLTQNHTELDFSALNECSLVRNRPGHSGRMTGLNQRVEQQHGSVDGGCFYDGIVCPQKRTGIPARRRTQKGSQHGVFRWQQKTQK